MIKKKNAIKSLEEQIHSLKEDITSNLNNKENISEHTIRNCQGKHQTQSTLHTKVKMTIDAINQRKATSVRTLLKMYRINEQMIPRIMKQ